MARKQHSGPSGLIVVDKPAGMTSHDVVSRLRRLAKTPRVGHAGTLDPMATGLLILGVGKATKLLRWLVGESKTYRATIRLGAVTVTDDAEGDVLEYAEPEKLAALTPEAIGQETEKLTGDIMQVPSAVSAIRVNGVRSYARVRDGERVQLEARPVRVSEFSVHTVEMVTQSDGRVFCDLEVTVSCSAGTYIRALARDLGAALGVGGHVRVLRRVRVGEMELPEAYTLAEVEKTVESGNRLPLLLLDDAAARLFPVRSVSAGQATDLSHGRSIELDAALPTPARAPVEKRSQQVIAAYAPSGQLVALVENRQVRGKQVTAPVLVFEAGQRFDPVPETGVCS